MRAGSMSRTSGKTSAADSRDGATAAPVRNVALLANPDSGSADPAGCSASLRSFGADVKRFDLHDLERVAESGAERLVVAGGDGSIAPVAALAGRLGVPLAVIPAGTANDFARGLGLPDDQSAACRLAVHGTSVRSLELGWMEPPAGGEPRRPFVNVASAGLPAPASRRAAAWKRPLGALAYAAGALTAGLTADPVNCVVECGGRDLFAGAAWQVTVAASGAFGGGSEIAEADPTDGALEVVAVGAGPRRALGALAFRLRRGTATSHPRARHASCITAMVSTASDTLWNVDGEVVSFGPARFRAQHAAFELVVG